MVLWKSFERHLFEFFLIVYRVHPQYNLLYEKYLQVCYCLLNFLYSYTMLASWRPKCFIVIWPFGSVSLSLSAVSNTRFIAAVIERHTHSPERRRRYWGRSGTESDHGKSAYVCMCIPSSKSKGKTVLVGLKRSFWNKGQRKIQRRDHQIPHLRIYWEFYYWNKAKPSPGAVYACVRPRFHWRLQAWVTWSLQCMLNLPPLRDEAFWRSLCNQQEEKGQPYSTRRDAMRDLEEESQQSG